MGFCKLPHKLCSNSEPISLQLKLDDDIVYIKGMNTLECELSTPSLLRGMLEVTVLKPNVSLDSLKITLNGFKSETIFIRDKASDHSVGNFLRRMALSGFIIRDSIDWSYGSQVLTRDQSYHDHGWTTIWKALVKSFCGSCTSKTPEYYLTPGIYTHSFRFVIDPFLPESLDTYMGYYRYSLEGSIKYFSSSSARKKSLTVPIQVIRCLSDSSTMDSQAVSCKGRWRDSFDYEFFAHNKAINQGSTTDVSIELFCLPAMRSTFKLHCVSIWLVQDFHCNTFHNNHLGTPKDKTTLSQKMLLKIVPINNSMFSEEGKLNAMLTVRIPTRGEKLYDSNTGLAAYAYPHTPDHGTTSLNITHQINVVIDIEPTSSVDTPDSRFDDSKGGSLLQQEETGSDDDCISKETQLNSSVSSPRKASTLYQLTETDISQLCYRKLTQRYYAAQGCRNRVELSMKASVFVLNERSALGNIAPPNYLDISIRNGGSKENQGYVPVSSPGVGRQWGLPPQYQPCK